VLALVALLVAGCGGDGGEDAQATIDKAFSTPVESANLTLSLTAQVEGVAELEQPVEVKLSGPFQSNGDSKLPSLDWQASLSGAGQSFNGGVISTGDNAYVSFQGTNYEVGEAQIAQINEQLSTQTEGKTLADFGIDPKNWLTDPSVEGDEDVNGASTTHVTAGVDIEKMLSDLNTAAEQTSGAMGQTATQLPQEQIDMIKEVVKEPTMDVYVGKDDDTLRRLNFSIDFEIPEDQRAQFDGATGGNLTFSLDLANVGEEQTIEAPQDARPLSELQGQLGGLSGGSGATPPDSSGSGGSGSGGSGSGGSGDGPSSEDFEAYSKCLEQADPSNTAEIQKCAELLK
jgi:hypothetical protein